MRKSLYFSNANLLIVFKDIIVENSNFGVVSKDYSNLQVIEGNINNTSTCFAAYSKKQEFSGGKIVLDSVSCNKTQNLFYSRHRS